jgi:hypothetical protein
MHVALKIRIQAKRSFSGGDAIMKRFSILDCYRVLRVHQQWTMFQAIRYALWLCR